MLPVFNYETKPLKFKKKSDNYSAIKQITPSTGFSSY